MQNKMIQEPSKECIASIAMYREMVNKGLDIYDILSQFISFIVHDKNLKSFSAQEINQHLKEVFNYTIPEAALKEALKKIKNVEPIDDAYQLTSSINYDEEFLSSKKRLEKETDDIFNDIVRFIEDKQTRSLNDQEKAKVFNELFDFLLKNERKNKQYTKLISLWVLQNSENSHVQNTLNIIKEGGLVTCAFDYTPSENKEKIWNTPLTLYYDIENLFSLEGLNGKTFTILSNDLYNLVQECNKKSKNQLIRLMYFSSVKQEVESFYNAAFEILKKGKKTFQSRTAMANILSGCDYPSDVQERKIKFFKTLSYKGFTEFDVSKYEENDYQYNIIDNETIAKLKGQFSRYTEEELAHVQNVLNKINHLRKNKSFSFYKCGHFFVTETGAMLNIALNSEILRPDTVPLATNTEYLTERIWAKTNSSFRSGKPKSVNAVVMAQLILSFQVNIKIVEKYEELQQRYKEESINQEEANEVLVTLREIRNQMQKNSVDNAENMVEFLDASIDEHIEKQNKVKIRLQEAEHKISNMEREEERKIQAFKKNSLEHHEEIENARQYDQKKAALQKKFIPFGIVFFLLILISSLLNRFFSDSFIRLILDIINTIGLMGIVLTILIALIKLRILEKNKNSDW